MKGAALTIAAYLNALIIFYDDILYLLELL